MTTHRKTRAVPQRAQTDESLRAERDNADRALAERRAVVEREADDVVDRARDNADAVLLEAREKADDHLDSPDAARSALDDERAIEDETLKNERAAADDLLQREREETARALSKLLPLERDKTDRYLLTERVHSDDALANRDDFLGIVSHDLRNLLGAIVMSAEFLSLGAEDDERGKKLTAGTMRILRYAARMSRLIADLVDVASIDSGRLAITAASADLGATIVEAAEAFRTTASEKKIAIETELVGQSLHGTFDHDRIFQVLANLLTNAIKFSTTGGTIVLSAERTSDGLVLSVRDTGIGIPTDMIEQVFQRFWQVDKHDRRGTGLGLYISKCIVEAHGGTIAAESIEGQGSVFTVRLPVAPAA
jgi:signal transduction histidine kinase